MLDRWHALSVIRTVIVASKSVKPAAKTTRSLIEAEVGLGNVIYIPSALISWAVVNEPKGKPL